jgi:hypothetical protein
VARGRLGGRLVIMVPREMQEEVKGYDKQRETDR